MRPNSSLETQCAAIGWPLQFIHAVRVASKQWVDTNGVVTTPEELVASRVIESGRACSWCEGGSVNLLMKAAALDTLANKNPFKDRKDAVQRYFEAQCTILSDYKNDLLHCIQNVKHEHLIQNISEICANPFIKDAYPKVTLNFMLSLANALHGDRLAEIASLFMTKPYDYRSGWPDLTVIEDGSVSFIEIKTTDLLHVSQLRFAEEIAKPLGFECSIIQLKRED